MDPIRLYDYLLLSRGRVLELVRPLTDAQYRSEHPIGLGSLARTLHHVRAAEHAYMQRLNGDLEPLPAPPSELDPEVTANDALPFARLEPAWRAQGERVRADLAAVTDWNTPMTCRTNWDGVARSYRASRGDFLSQLVLHEVHHRAQVLQMLRRLGIEAPELDFNALMWTPIDPA